MQFHALAHHDDGTFRHLQRVDKTCCVQPVHCAIGGQCLDGLGELRRRRNVLAGQSEVEIEIQRVDGQHLGAGIGRLAHAQTQQRRFMARIAAQQQDAVGLLDLGQRHAERLGDRCVRQIGLRNAVIDIAATQARGQTAQQGALFVAGRRMHQHADIVTTLRTQDVDGLGQRFVPARLAPVAVLAQHRRSHAICCLQALMRIAVAIRQPALVDGFVVARHGTQRFAATRVQEQVGAQRIVIADAVAGNQLPGARLEAKYLVGQCTDRADVDDVAGKLALQRLAVVGADLQTLAAIHTAEFIGAADFTRGADAARALDTAGHVAGDQRTEVLVRHHALALGEAADRTAVAHRQVLQFALAALIADRAIQRVIDQQELHDVALGVQRALGAGIDLHARHHRRGAGRRRLGHLLDVDKAHAAVGRDRQLLVVAEARYRHARLVRGLDDHRALRHLHGFAVDLDLDQVRVHRRILWLRAHAASSTLPSTIDRPFRM